MLSSTLRAGAKVLFILSLAAFVISAALVSLSWLVQKNGGQRLEELLNTHLPGLSVHYASADINFSLRGAHFRAYQLQVQAGDSAVRADSADVWLTGGGELKALLRAPEFYIGENLPAAADADAPAAGLPLQLSAPNARVIIAAAGLTLTDIDIAFSAGEDGWRLHAHQLPQLQIKAAGDAAQPLRLHAELRDFTLPPALAPPFSYRGMRMTIAAQSAGGAGGALLPLQARAAGGWQGIESAAHSLTLAAAHLYSSGRWQGGDDLQMNLAAAAAGVRSAAGEVGRLKIGARWRQDGQYFFIDDGRLQLDGVSGDFRGAGIRPPQCFDALGCIANARLDARAGGRIALPHAPGLTVAMTIAGEFLKNAENHWRLHATPLALADRGVTLQATLGIRAAAVTVLTAAGGLTPMAATAVAAYFPAGELREWLEESLAAGALPYAAFSARAPRLFDDPPDIQATIAFRGGRLAIGDGWQPAEQLDGTVFIDNDDVVIRGRGVFDGLPVPEIIARLPDTAAAQNTLFLNLQSAAAALTGIAAAARRAPATRDLMRDLDDQLSLRQGRGRLSLALTLPLQGEQNGDARGFMSVQHAELQAGALPPYQNIAGRVVFANDDVAGRLRGRIPGMALGAPPLQADFNAATLTLSGALAAPLLLSVAGLPPALASGAVAFTLLAAPDITLFHSALDGAALKLPAPLAKAAGERVSLRVQFAGERSRVAYHAAHITVSARIAAAGSDVAINAAAAAPSAGTRLHGAAANADVDGWLQLGGFVSGGGDEGGYLSAIQLTLTEAALMGETSPRLILDGASAGAGQPLSLRIDSPLIAGALIAGGDFLRGDFSRLPVPLQRDTFGGGMGDTFAALTVSLAAATLVAGGLTLGRLELAGAPHDDLWRLDALKVSRPHITLQLGGAYEQQQTLLSLHLIAADLPALISVLHIPPVFGGGRVSLLGAVSWPGSPLDFTAAGVSGGLRLLAQDVRYLDVSFGSDIVNMLAAFSPRSIFSLGFTDLALQGGEVFHQVQGDINLNAGKAEFDAPLILVSRDVAASVLGSTDYIHKVHALHGEVRPGEKLLEAGTTLGLGTGLMAINPVSFVAGTILGNVLEEQLSGIGGYHYKITGPWSDPVFEKTEQIEEEEAN